MRVRVEAPSASLGVVRLTGIALPEDYSPLLEPKETGDLTPARKLYRSIGQEPTRHRPSSELLIRRIRKGLGLPRINALVDAVNHCSATLALPFGCHDLERLSGDEVVLRLGLPGEGFEGVGHRRVNVESRFALCDAAGPFGNPTMDSRRACIRPETRNALIAIYAPADHPHDRLDWVTGVLTAAVGGSAATDLARP